MAEIYSSSEASALSTLSQEDADHINRVLADLGLSGPPVVATQPADGAGPASVDHSTASTMHDGIATAGSGAPAVAMPSTGDDTFHLTGLGDDTLSAGNDGFPAATDASGTATHNTLGNDSLPGGSDGGLPPPVATGHNDTLAGGNGMDTLWGSGASNLADGAGSQADHHGGAGTGETGAAAAGIDTLHAGHASFAESAAPALSHAEGDVAQVHASHDTLDGSVSAHGSTVDVFGSHSTIIGGSGNDTLAQHDGSGTPGWAFGGAGEDTLAASAGGHSTLQSGTGTEHVPSWGTTESVLGGDGSDIYAMTHHYGAGYDTTDSGMGGESAASHDHAFGSHFASDAGATIVTFGDGYGSHLTGIENIQFHDTVYNI